MWEITQNEVVKYDDIFLQLNPIDGKLDGEKVKQVMMKSQLSVETLGKVWDLADMDSDGFLDRNEFLLAMHLVYRCTEGDMLPPRLPGHILFDKDQYFAKYPPRFPLTGSLSARNTYADTFPSGMAIVPITTGSSAFSPGVDLPKQPLALMPNWPASAYQQSSSTPSGGPASPSSVSLAPPTTTTAYPPWAISAEELAKASALFASLDVDADGLVSGQDTREVLLRSHLQQNVLVHIWDLVDMHGVGMLNREQFAVILHLISEQLNPTRYPSGLPDRLPPALVPPSLRPVPPDPGLFDESNRLIAQIEAIKKECCALEAGHAQPEAASRRRTAEAAEKTRLAEAHERVAQSLTEQNAEAGRHLGEFAAQRDALREQLQELKQKVETEHQHVDQVRSQVDAQQALGRDQECELTRLRGELNELIREETQLKDRVTSSQRRLEAIEAETRETQRRVEQTNQQVTALQSTRGQLMEVIDQYQAMLNGDPSAVAPGELHVKLLLANGSGSGGAGGGGGSTSLTGSFASFDTGLGGGSGVGGGGGAGWPPSPTPSTSVRTHTNGGGASAFEPLQDSSPLAVGATATANDDSGGGGGANGAGQAPFVFDSDPFGPPSQPFVVGPFKNNDPFASDPFGFPNTVAESTNLSAFDPFLAPVPRAPPTESDKAAFPTAPSHLNDSDFDTVFGPPVDLFSSDPFSAVEKCAEQQQQHQTATPATAISSTRDDSVSSSTLPKRYPPPRPTSQPGAANPVSGRKSTGDQPEHYYLSKRFDTSSSASCAVRTSPLASKKKSSSGSTRSFHLLPRGRSKKDDSLSSRGSHPSWKSPPASGSLRQLTEEQQLSLAIMESAQLARDEARAKQQEEDDLRLAIQLSNLDTMSS